MIVAVIIVLIACLFAGSIESNLIEAFSGDWLRFDEEPTERERLELENEEFSWGHNVRNYIEE